MHPAAQVVSKYQFALPPLVRAGEPTTRPKAPVQNPIARVDAALANIDKLEASIAGVYEARFVARTNKLQRFIGKNPLTAVACFTGAVFAITGAIGHAFVHHSMWIVALIPAVAAAVATGVSADSYSQREGRREPIRSDEIRDTAELLDSMAPNERTLLRDHAERSIGRQVANQTMTPAASEVLCAKLALGDAADPRDVRASRAARLLHEIESTPATLATLEESLKGVLEEHPPEERRELATSMLARLFKNEACTLENLSAVRADWLYRTLRAAENAQE